MTDGLKEFIAKLEEDISPPRGDNRTLADVIPHLERTIFLLTKMSDEIDRLNKALSEFGHSST